LVTLASEAAGGEREGGQPEKRRLSKRWIRERGEKENESPLRAFPSWRESPMAICYGDAG
jgi:hypothetical protein